MITKQAAAAVCCLALALYARKRKRNPIKKREWVKPWIREREDYGAYDGLMTDLSITDPAGFQNFIRMSVNDFEQLVSKIGPLVFKQNSHRRNTIRVEERLAVTLHYLATGEQRPVHTIQVSCTSHRLYKKLV